MVTEKAICQVLYGDGRKEEKERAVMTEKSYFLEVNGVPKGKQVCTPSDARFLTLGRLATEGLCADKSQVLFLDLREDKEAIWATVRVDLGEPKKRALCKGYSWTGAEVFAVVEAGEQKAVSEVKDMHNCVLACEGKICFETEDVSCLNALDKAVGYAMEQELERSKCLLYTSGKVTRDMVKKAYRAGIPCLVSGLTATNQSIKFAKDSGMLLVCSAQTDQVLIYSGELD